MVIKEFSISPYGIAMSVAFIVSFMMVYRIVIKRRIPGKMIGYSMLLNVIMILYGAKMYTVITGGFQVSLWKAGLSSLGGVIGLLIGIFIFGCIYKEGHQVFFEAYVMVIPCLYGVSKIGCFLVGCCHGITYDGAFAVYYENSAMQGGPYFPVQLLESFVFIVIFLMGLWFAYGKKLTHTVSYIMILCAVAKFAIDFLREEHVGKIFSINQIICLGFFVWALVMIFTDVEGEKNNGV